MQAQKSLHNLFVLTFTDLKHKATLLLLSLQKQHHHLYCSNKPNYYKKIYEGIAARAYNITPENILKKMANMLLTYKQAKDGGRPTCEARVSWEYFNVRRMYLSHLSL